MQELTEGTAAPEIFLPKIKMVNPSSYQTFVEKKLFFFSIQRTTRPVAPKKPAPTEMPHKTLRPTIQLF